MASFGELNRRYVGLSSESKPTLDYGFTGSTFYETDTGQTHIWTGSQWREQFISSKVSFADSPSEDAFGRLRTSAPFGIFDNKQITSRNIGDWEERLWGCIIVHGVVTGAGFQVGETITGGTSAEKGTITAVNVGSIVYSTMGGNDFTDGETITGGTSLSTAIISTHNTGTDITYNYDRSSCYLKVGTANGDRAIRQTTRYFPYVPGKSTHIQATGKKGTGKTDVKQYLMYGDDLNGNGYCLDGTTLKIFIRSNTSGSAVDSMVAQSAWNKDKLDGTGPSGITLDITKSQIDGFDFQWLGVGRVRFSFDIGGQTIIVHEFNHANIDDVVYMRTPSLPIRYEIVNTGTTASATTLEQICSSVSSEGGYALPGSEFSAPPISVAAERAITTLQPIFAIRLKTAFPTGKPNRRQVRFLDCSFSARTNEAWFELCHVHDPITMTATWTSAHADSAVEYSTDISALTAMKIHPVQSDYVQSGNASQGQSSIINAEFISNHSYIAQNFESDNSQMLVVYAKPRTATSNVWSHISWIESD